MVAGSLVHIDHKGWPGIGPKTEHLKRKAGKMKTMAYMVIYGFLDIKA